MIEQATRLTHLSCEGCFRAPLLVRTRGKEVHHVECPRCGTRTAKHATREAAIRAWSDPKSRERVTLRMVAV